MAASINKVILIGNAGQAPDYRDHGNFVTASFTLATTKSWKDRETGERNERTDWHRIEVTGRLADIVRDIVQSGNQLYVEGELNTDRVARDEGGYSYFTKIRADVVQKLGKRERGDEPRDERSDAPAGHGTDESREQQFGEQAPAPAPAPVRQAAPAPARQAAPAPRVAASAPAPAAAAPAAPRAPAPAAAPAAKPAGDLKPWQRRGAASTGTAK